MKHAAVNHRTNAVFVVNFHEDFHQDFSMTQPFNTTKIAALVVRPYSHNQFLFGVDHSK